MCSGVAISEALSLGELYTSLELTDLEKNGLCDPMSNPVGSCTNR